MKPVTKFRFAFQDLPRKILAEMATSCPMFWKVKMSLRSRPLFKLTIEVHTPIDLGPCPAGVRQIFAVSGGRFVGERLRGQICPLIGSDLLVARQDGTFRQDVRMLLLTDDGAKVLMTYSGVRRASAEVVARLARGEAVDPSEYYLRTVPFFETSSSEYAWLNGVVSIGLGARVSGGVEYDVFEVL